MTSRCKGHRKKFSLLLPQIMNQLPSSIQDMNPNQEPRCNVLPSGQAEVSDLTKSEVPHTLSTTEKCFQQALNTKRIQHEASMPNPSKATNSEGQKPHSISCTCAPYKFYFHLVQVCELSNYKYCTAAQKCLK